MISIRLRQISHIGILISGMATVILLLVSFYGLSIGNFVIQIDDYDPQTGVGMQLSTDYHFTNPTGRLYATALERADNISYADIPDDIEHRDGDINDPRGNYFAYSFYLRNSGTKTIGYTAQINITELYKAVDSAIRVMIVKDFGERKIYAKPQEVGDHIGEPEPGTIPFYDHLNGIVYREVITEFEVGEISRYTIVIWLEGDDPQCVDDILGGGIKMEMRFDVIRTS